MPDATCIDSNYNNNQTEMDNTTGSAWESDFAALQRECDWMFSIFCIGILAYCLLMYFTVCMRELVRHWAGDRYRDNDDDDDDDDA